MSSPNQSVESSIWRALPDIGPRFDDSIESPKEIEVFPGDQLIPELVYHVFTYLPPEGLGCTSRVSKVWQEIASGKSLWDRFDLKQEFPQGLAFKDQAFWEEWVDTAALGLDFKGVPSLDNRIIIPLLKRLLAPGVIKGDAGVTVLTKPGGLDWDKLNNAAQNPKKGFPTQFRDIPPEVLTRLREIPASKACIFVISNNVLSGSRHYSAKVREELVRGIGGNMPEILPMATIAILTHISTGTRLYGDNPPIYTCCLEEIQIPGWKSKLVVGAFTSDGLSVFYYNTVPDLSGVGAMYKFPAIGT